MASERPSTHQPEQGPTCQKTVHALEEVDSEGPQPKKPKTKPQEVRDKDVWLGTVNLNPTVQLSIGPHPNNSTTVIQYGRSGDAPIGKITVQSNSESSHPRVHHAEGTELALDESVSSEGSSLNDPQPSTSGVVSSAVETLAVPTKNLAPNTDPASRREVKIWASDLVVVARNLGKAAELIEKDQLSPEVKDVKKAVMDMLHSYKMITSEQGMYPGYKETHSK